MHKLKIGSYVKYSRNWLRSTGNFTGDIPIAQGRIINIQDLGSLKLAIIEWNRIDIPEKVNIKNLVDVRDLQFEER